MKKLKMILPMLAFVLAVGMSLAFNSSKEDSVDYIFRNGQFESLELELNCGEGVQICEVQLEENGTIYTIYDQPNMSSQKKGNGDVIELFN